MDEEARSAEPELLDDVVLDCRRRRGCERDDRRGPQRRQVLAQLAVVGTKSWPHCEMQCASSMAIQRRFALGQHLGEANHAQPLRSDEQELEFAAQIFYAGLPRLRAVQPGVDCGATLKPSEASFDRLVVHERDQRADHQRRATQGQARQTG